MKRATLIILMLLIPLSLIISGIDSERDILIKIGLFIFLFYLVLGVFYGEDKLR